jgi:hypothetical protein
MHSTQMAEAFLINYSGNELFKNIIHRSTLYFDKTNSEYYLKKSEILLYYLVVFQIMSVRIF